MNQEDLETKIINGISIETDVSNNKKTNWNHITKYNVVLKTFKASLQERNAHKPFRQYIFVYVYMRTDMRWTKRLYILNDIFLDYKINVLFS